MDFLKMALAIAGGYVLATLFYFMLGILFGIIGLGAFITAFTHLVVSVGLFWCIAIWCTIKIKERTIFRDKQNN